MARTVIASNGGGSGALEPPGGGLTKAWQRRCTLRALQVSSGEAPTRHAPQTAGRNAAANIPGTMLDTKRPGGVVLLYAGIDGDPGAADREPTNAARAAPAQAGALAPPSSTLPALAADLEGEVLDVSVLMADLRGFTTFCERVTPRRMSRVLNDYLTSMVDVILSRQGRVQDFVGDGILAVFGAPDRDPDHAWHAVLAALDMQAAIRWLNGRWRREGGTPFALGVAVHTGEVFAGVVGSPRQSKYAVVGDTVNTVARLEELNRNLGTRTVMSGDAVARAGDRVEVRPRGVFALRGRSHTVEVFELLGAKRVRRATHVSPLRVVPLLYAATVPRVEDITAVGVAGQNGPP